MRDARLEREHRGLRLRASGACANSERHARSSSRDHHREDARRSGTAASCRASREYLPRLACARPNATQGAHRRHERLAANPLSQYRDGCHKVRRLPRRPSGAVRYDWTAMADHRAACPARLADADRGREDQGRCWPRSPRATSWRPPRRGPGRRLLRLPVRRSASTPRRRGRPRCSTSTASTSSSTRTARRTSAAPTIDFVDGLQESGFKIDNPNVSSSCGCGHSFQVDDERGEPADGRPPAAAPAARTSAPQAPRRRIRLGA